MDKKPIVPEQASSFAQQMDILFYVLVGLTVLFTLIVFGGIAYFVWKYRAGSKADRSNPPEGNLALEIAWTVIPTILGLAVFFWAAKLYVQAYSPQKTDLSINVIGKQWMWQFQHPNGVRENNELHIPVGKDITFTMISQDVIHSMFIPAFRIKKDVMPGRYTVVGIKATKPGKYRLLCAEFCGTEHSTMIGWVFVMEPADYEKWLTGGGQPEGQTPIPTPPNPSVNPAENSANNQPVLSLVDAGKKLYTDQGCASCHNETATARGPSHIGIYGTKIKLADGSTAIVDDNYIRESLKSPNVKIVEGYQPIMNTYDFLTEEQIMQIIAYVKSLKAVNNGSAP